MPPRCLARSGVGELTLVDQDTVSVTNINRQLCALHSTVGQSKAEVTARRCRDIYPSAVGSTPSAPPTTPPTGRISSPPDMTISPTAIDLVTCKLDLIEQAMDAEASPSCRRWGPATSWTPPCCR